MSLADKLSQTPAPTGTKCLLARIRDDLDEADRTTLDGWLEQYSGVTNIRIAKALTASGWKISYSTVANHRAANQRCGCSL